MAKPADGIDWKAPDVIATPDGVKGVISAPTGIEEKPCFTCAKWIKDTRRLMQHFTSHGLQPNANGIYEVPVQKYNRRSIQVDPKDWGWCPKLVMPTHMLATCEFWTPTNLTHELAGKIR